VTGSRGWRSVGYVAGAVIWLREDLGCLMSRLLVVLVMLKLTLEGSCCEGPGCSFYRCIQETLVYAGLLFEVTLSQQFNALLELLILA